MQYIQQIDNSILMIIHNNVTNPFFDSIMPVITSLANGGVLWLAIGLMFLCSTKYRKSGLILLCALALCFIIGNLGLKPLVARVRPFDINTTIHLLISKPKDFSFPSGHTMHSFAAATVLYHMNKRIGIGAYILAIAIAFSRMYLYVHYPSDVLFGIIIGVLLALVSIKLCEKVAKKANEYKTLKDVN